MDTTEKYCKVGQDWTLHELTAKWDMTGHYMNLLQSSTGQDTTRAYYKVGQDWTLHELTAKWDKTGH